MPSPRMTPPPESHSPEPPGPQSHYQRLHDELGSLPSVQRVVDADVVVPLQVESYENAKSAAFDAHHDMMCAQMERDKYVEIKKSAQNILEQDKSDREAVRRQMQQNDRYVAQYTGKRLSGPKLNLIDMLVFGIAACAFVATGLLTAGNILFNDTFASGLAQGVFLALPVCGGAFLFKAFYNNLTDAKTRTRYFQRFITVGIVLFFAYCALFALSFSGSIGTNGLSDQDIASMFSLEPQATAQAEPSPLLTSPYLPILFVFTSLSFESFCVTTCWLTVGRLRSETRGITYVESQLYTLLKNDEARLNDAVAEGEMLIARVTGYLTQIDGKARYLGRQGASVAGALQKKYQAKNDAVKGELVGFDAAPMAATL